MEGIPIAPATMNLCSRVQIVERMATVLATMFARGDHLTFVSAHDSLIQPLISRCHAGFTFSGSTCVAGNEGCSLCQVQQLKFEL
jgi:hypothetical protein